MVDQVCAKRDVSRAFKWHFLRAEDTPEFGTSLPGSPVGITGKVYGISLVMTFGWTGSPGEYMPFAWAAQAYHGHFRPSRPDRNDTVAFDSSWLMDDGVDLQPLLGDRPWQSELAMEDGMHKVWGPEAINQAKKEEEGQWRKKQLVGP